MKGTSLRDKWLFYTRNRKKRTRISADMHDELGSGVTVIRLMSEIVKSKMKEQTLPEIEKNIPLRQ